MSNGKDLGKLAAEKKNNTGSTFVSKIVNVYKYDW
jgi:hypothetical protein